MYVFISFFMNINKIKERGKKKHKRTLRLIFKEMKKYKEDFKEDEYQRYCNAFNKDFDIKNKPIDEIINKKYSNGMNDFQY